MCFSCMAYNTNIVPELGTDRDNCIYRYTFRKHMSDLNYQMFRMSVSYILHAIFELSNMSIRTLLILSLLIYSKFLCHCRQYPVRYTNCSHFRIHYICQGDLIPSRTNSKDNLFPSNIFLQSVI